MSGSATWEVSRARQCLTGACVAPGSEETLRELQNRRPVPPEVLDWEPEKSCGVGSHHVHQQSEELVLHADHPQGLVGARTNI